MLKIGSVVDGKYKILNIAGKGGMSVVYLAINEKVNKQWAIKEIIKQDDQDFDMDKKEIEMLKRLKHPNLPAIVDVIERKDTLLIVMDYIEGRTLEDIVSEYGPLSEKSVIRWAKQLCDVLHYLHTRTPPIIYRDMKPSNIMLKPDGNVVLIDFGAAREYKHQNDKDTVLLGTRGYAAPEQYRPDGQSDARTDIYSLGVTVFRMLTGQLPQELKPIREVRSELSAGLEYIMQKCTRVRKEERYQSARELMFALKHYWEYDEKYRRQQKKKMCQFLIPFVAMVIFAVCTVTFGYKGYDIRRNNYAAYLSSAKNSSSGDEKLENYQKAIRLDPKNEEAYLGLLQNAFLDDGVFSKWESDFLRNILIGYGEGLETNERAFRKNTQGYAAFAYEAGIAYFYKYEDKNDKKNARGYFEIAAGAEHLEEKKRERASRLFMISDYYAKIGMIDEAGDVYVSYREYWEDLTAAAEGNLVEEDNERTALVMYGEIVNQVISRTVDFIHAGVASDEIRDQLKYIERHLQDDFSDLTWQTEEIYRDEIKALKQDLAAAEKIVQSAETQIE